MNKVNIVKKVILSLSILMNIELLAQDQLDMTVLFDYFDSTVTIYVDGDEIVIEGDGVPSHYSPYFVETYSQTRSFRGGTCTGWDRRVIHHIQCDTRH